MFRFLYLGAVMLITISFGTFGNLTKMNGSYVLQKLVSIARWKVFLWSMICLIEHISFDIVSFYSCRTLLIDRSCF